MIELAALIICIVLYAKIVITKYRILYILGKEKVEFEKDREAAIEHFKHLRDSTKRGVLTQINAFMGQRHELKKTIAYLEGQRVVIDDSQVYKLEETISSYNSALSMTENAIDSLDTWYFYHFGTHYTKEDLTGLIHKPSLN